MFAALLCGRGRPSRCLQDISFRCEEPIFRIESPRKWTKYQAVFLTVPVLPCSQECEAGGKRLGDCVVCKDGDTRQCGEALFFARVHRATHDNLVNLGCPPLRKLGRRLVARSRHEYICKCNYNWLHYGFCTNGVANHALDPRSLNACPHSDTSPYTGIYSRRGAPGSKQLHAGRGRG